MNNKKLFGIAIIILALLLLFLIIYFVWFYNWASPPEDEETAPVMIETPSLPVSSGDPVISLPPIIAPPEKRELTRDDLKKMAASFAERFGSYSNHSNYGNISDLKIFMSRKMQVWADNFIAEAKDEYSGIYYGITTKSITQEIQDFNESSGTAKILVKTQRKESTGVQGNETVFYQDIVIDFVKENQAWKVDGAFWQKK